MEYSQKYTLVAFLTPVEVGFEFEMSDWPMHVTLADVFAIDLDTDIEQKLARLLVQQSPISLTVGEEAILGTTRVSLINKNSKLQDLHESIIDLLESNGVVFNMPHFTRQGFLPHSAVQESTKLNVEDVIEISSISLIDMFPKGDWQQRKVIDTFKFDVV